MTTPVKGTAVPWWRTELGEAERDALVAAFDHRQLSMGAKAAELEMMLSRELDVPYVVVTPSGTAALTMALMAADVGPGDEVIVPDLTWIATAQAAHMLGARVVLVDSLSQTPVLDVDAVERLLSRRTKAVIPVHFHGRPCDMTRLVGLCRDKGIALIEDACKAMLCRSGDRFLGTIGEFGCFSMGMISLLSVGYGGFVTTRDPASAEKLRFMRDHGVRRRPTDEYLHPGFNFKVSDLLSAMGVVQAARFREKTAHVTRIYELYADGLSDNEFVSLMEIDVTRGIVPICADLLTPYRAELELYLAEKQIAISPFHVPLHCACYLDAAPDTDFPNSTRFAREGLIAPCGPGQPLTNVERVVDALRAWRPRAGTRT